MGDPTKIIADMVRAQCPVGSEVFVGDVRQEDGELRANVTVRLPPETPVSIDISAIRMTRFEDA